MQTETVEVHSLQKNGDDWTLCVYQTPSVLRVREVALAERLQKALEESLSVVLSWEPESGLVVRCDF